MAVYSRRLSLFLTLHLQTAEIVNKIYVWDFSNAINESRAQ